MNLHPLVESQQPIEDSPSRRRKDRLANQGAAIGGVIMVVWAAGYAVSDWRKFAPIIGCNLTAAAFCFAAVWLARRGLLAAARHLVLAMVVCYLAAVTWLIGRDNGLHHWYYLVLVVAVFTAPGPISARVYPALGIAGLVACTWWAPAVGPIVAVSPRFAELSNALLSGLACIFMLRAFDRDMVTVEERLAAEHARSERLLANILPEAISARLKSGATVIADRFSTVTVVFADIVGFTELSSRIPPEQLVEILNSVFSRFDDLTSRHGLEKIKTVGDAYMAVAGLPEACPDHADRAAGLALGLIETVESLPLPAGMSLQVRVGMHSGSVVAGVIGKRKFAYDLWGDTVNVAARMESHGQPSAVHVSEETAELLTPRWRLEPRGTIVVKGKGDMTTYFLHGPA